MFTALRHQFLSWTRQSSAMSSHPALLISTLTSAVHRSSTWVFPFRFFPTCCMSRPLHPPSSDRPKTNCDTPHYTNPPPPVTYSLLRHTSSPQRPVAKHTQQLCPRCHRPTLRQEFLRTARHVHWQPDGAEGLQKWWATDNVWTRTHEKPIKDIPTVITPTQLRNQIFYEMSFRDEWHNLICTATSAVSCYCGQDVSTNHLHVAQMWRYMYIF